MEKPYYEIIIDFDPAFLRRLKVPKIYQHKERDDVKSQVSHLIKQGLKSGRHFNVYLRD